MGYYKIARHYKWALSQIFDVMHHKAVIVVEGILHRSASRVYTCCSGGNGGGGECFSELLPYIYR